MAATAIRTVPLDDMMVSSSLSARAFPGMPENPPSGLQSAAASATARAASPGGEAGVIDGKKSGRRDQPVGEGGDILSARGGWAIQDLEDGCPIRGGTGNAAGAGDGGAAHAVDADEMGGIGGRSHEWSS